ncbi:MAG: MFS transporter [Prevotella sp.]|jgi:PAT family beta-lactamase induction signal transducer AmpG|nr:MFS transporter [Prevotella sp.]MCI2080249.1 MFS transporter [Prevotella sp.]MCI2102109.1 MFS transporter [Prevotella sp.]
MKKRNPWSWVPTLYFAEGLPYVAVTAISLILYKQLGLHNAEITFYLSWLLFPWVIKPLWCPFINLLQTKRWWVVTMELLIGAAFGGVAFTIPTSQWLQGSLFFFWVMAFASITHDYAAGRYYMVEMEETSHHWLVRIRSAFFCLATIFGQGILVMVAGNLQVIYRNSISYSWSLLFYGTCGLVIALWLWHTYILPFSQEDRVDDVSSPAQVWEGIRDSFQSFFRKPHLVTSLCFILFFILPEGLLSKVSALFLIDAIHNGGLGLSPQEFGLVQGTVGVIGLSFGGLIGSIVVKKEGIGKWIWLMACAVTVPDLFYVYLSTDLPRSLTIISMSVFLQHFCYGFGYTAYALFLISFSRGEDSNRHYAICAGLMSLSWMLSGMFSGALQEAVGYRRFFLIVMACGIATLIVTLFVNIRPTFGRKVPDDEDVEE